jgi:hypothetical protein
MPNNAHMLMTMTPQSSDISKAQCLPPLKDVLQVYFSSLESMGCLDDVVVGKNLVENLKQQENGADEQIYNKLVALFLYVQSPLVQYERVDSGYMAACRSEQAVWQEANDMSSHADTEFMNKRKCIKAEECKAHHETTVHLRSDY